MCRSPDLPEELCLGNDLIGVGDQCLENGKFLAREMHGSPATDTWRLARSMRRWPSSYIPTSDSCCTPWQTQHVAYARQKFLNAERFGDIVVGAGIEHQRPSRSPFPARTGSSPGPWTSCAAP